MSSRSPSPSRTLVAPGPGTSTVDRIVFAAAQTFADKGFAATTTRDIAGRAGLSPAGVYVHFASKEELLYRLALQGHEAAIELLEHAVSSAASPAAQLTALMREFTRWHVHQFELAKVVQYEHRHLTPEHQAEVLALRKQMDAIVRRVLQSGVDSAEFSVDSIPDTALALLSIIVDVSRWYSTGLRRTPEQIADTNARLALRLVGAQPS